MDDKNTLATLAAEIGERKVLVLAPGKSLTEYSAAIGKYIAQENPVVIAVNFLGGQFAPDYIFSSNMRRYAKIQGKTSAKCITTSNMKDCKETDYVVNFASYASKDAEIIDNSGVMLLKLLLALGVKEVSVAGMDGYSSTQSVNYFDSNLEYDFSSVADTRNRLIAAEIKEIGSRLQLSFLTPTAYIYH